MFKKLQRLFHDVFRSNAKQQRRHFQEWQRTRPPLPDLPVTELVPVAHLVQQPITPIPYVPGIRLAIDRAKRGLRTVRLVPLQNTEGFPALPTASTLDANLAVLHELLDGYAETEKLPRVKAP